MTTYVCMAGLTREHALSLTAAYPTVMLQHLQQNDPIYRPTTWLDTHAAVLSVFVCVCVSMWVYMDVYACVRAYTGRRNRRPCSVYKYV